MKYIHYIIALGAVMLAGCGKTAPPSETEPAGTTSALPAFTVLTTSAAETEPPESEPDEEPGDEYDEEEYDGEEEDENAVAELKLNKSDIDPKKPFDPDKSALGSGKESFAYPMNSIMLTVRQSPYESAKVRTKLLSGTGVTILGNAFFGFSDCWSYISCDGGKVRGWCHAQDLTAMRFEWLDFEGLEMPEVCFDHADFSEGIYDVLADGAELRTAPGGEVRGKIKKGTTVRAFGETKSAKGWLFAAVSAEYLDAGGTGELYGWVNTDGGKALRIQKKEK